jgi:hypothetical protein
MVQLWVNLPAKDKMAVPRYQTLLNREIALIELGNGAGQVRVIAGEYAAQRGPARTATPMNVWDLRLKQGHVSEWFATEGHTLALIVLRGELLVNGSEVLRDAQMVRFERSGRAVTLDAQSDVTALWLSGEPIDEPVVGYGPFVMNSEPEIRQAISDFNSGRFGQLRA